MIAQGIIAAIATGLAIASGYLAVTGVSVAPSTQTSLNQMKPYVDRVQLAAALDTAKSQNLVPMNYTLSQAGF
jgi:hypothetical protein